MGCLERKMERWWHESYSIQMKGPSVHFKVLACKFKKKSSCAHWKVAVVVPSKSKKYPSTKGWVQVSNIHGGRVIVYLKRVGKVLSLHWYRPKTHWHTAGTGKIFTPHAKAPGWNLLGVWSVKWKDGGTNTYFIQ